MQRVEQSEVGYENNGMETSCEVVFQDLWSACEHLPDQCKHTHCANQNGTLGAEFQFYNINFCSQEGHACWVWFTAGREEVRKEEEVGGRRGANWRRENADNMGQTWMG